MLLAAQVDDAAFNSKVMVIHGYLEHVLILNKNKSKIIKVHKYIFQLDGQGGAEAAT